MPKNLLCVFQSFDHSFIIRAYCTFNGVVDLLSGWIDKYYQFIGWAENYLCFICEIHLYNNQKLYDGISHLNNFIAESEHYGVLGLHPLLDIHEIWGVEKVPAVDTLLVAVVAQIWFVGWFLKVRLKVLQQVQFLRQLLRVVMYEIPIGNVSFILLLPDDILKVARNLRNS